MMAATIIGSRNVRDLLCLLVVVAVAMMGGCAQCGENAAEQLLLQQYSTTVYANDYRSILALMEPARRPEYARMLSLHEEYTRKGHAVESLLQQKFGKMARDTFEQRFFQPFGAMFEGVLLWSRTANRTIIGRTTFVRHDSISSVLFDQQETGIIIKRVGDARYISFSETRRVRGDADVYAAMLSELICNFQYIIQGIEDGAINAGNLNGIITGSQPPPGMPVKRAYSGVDGCS
jgi:hypothetical protein